MRLFTILFAVIVSSACTFKGNSMSDKKYDLTAQSAVNFCIEEYKKLSGKNFFEEVDRAYVLSLRGKYELLFSRGEVGIFGPRSDIYKPFLLCGILSSVEGMNLYYLGEPLKRALVENPGVKQISAGDSEGAWDALYLRKDNQFDLQIRQKYKQKKIEVRREGGLIID